MNYSDEALSLHKKYKGKIEIKSKVPLETKDELSAAYTPGVGSVCEEIKKDISQSWELTNRSNQVAIITDGTAILGLGDIGPEAGMPVMEGKSAIFKEFAGIDAFPLCINTKNVEEIINFCKWIEPSFGGINLEDISAPRCFEILERLESELNIAVFHDDQDGTAIVVLAALINACRASNRVLNEQKVVINGSGAAGIAIARLLLAQGVKDIIMVDSTGAIYADRGDLNNYKLEIAEETNLQMKKGDLAEVMKGRDVFIGVSLGNLVSEDMVRSMSKDPIIFAMANPIPEIMPEQAKNAGALIVGTGRSDFENQINNALVFPGIFRGLLDSRKKKVTMTMKLQVAIAIAYIVKEPTLDNIIPKVTDRNVVKVIAETIKNIKTE